MSKTFRVQLVVWLKVEADNEEDAIAMGREWTKEALSFASERLPNSSIASPFVPELSKRYLKNLPAEEAIVMDHGPEEPSK